MKNILVFTIIPAISLSCVSHESDSTSQAAAVGNSEESTQDDGSDPPRIGMTQAQVRAKYGRPVNVSSSPQGDTWSYAFNNVDGRDFIPVYGAFHQATKKRNSSIIHFDRNGRVRDYTWNELNPMGGTIWR